MNKSDKNFDTSLRILEVLKILHNSSLSKLDMINEMNKNPDIENVYTFEAFIKYFNTLSLLGFDIEKEKNKYKLKNTFKSIHLNIQETEVLFDIISYIQKLHNKNVEKRIKDIVYKSLKYMDYKTQNKVLALLNSSVPNIKSNNIIQSLESMLYDGQLVEITYLKRNNIQDKITVCLKEIIEKKGEIVLVCSDKSKSRNKKINVSSLISISQTPRIAEQNEYSNYDVAVFRLYGRLSQLYKLKNGEKTLDFSSEYITVANKGEDRDILLRRLLKYGENCKIVQPQNLKDDFMILTNDILKNIENGL